MTQDKHKLLVVDDSELIRKAVAMLLENAGYEVRVAASIAEFDELLASWWPDTILTDVQMPDMTGDELCRRLKSRLLVRVILFSNLPPTQLATLADSAGADGFISKLAGFSELPDSLAKILHATQTEESDDAAASSSTYKVVLLDDTDLGREVTGTVLAREGFDVRIASTLEEFGDVFGHWDPNAILTVPKLGDLPEGEVCRHLKAKMGAHTVPILFFSNESNEGLVDLARRFGADDALSKLDGFDELFKKLRRVCEG
jgi:DNA-binding response OmpR family regulator